MEYEPDLRLINFHLSRNSRVKVCMPWGVSFQNMVGHKPGYHHIDILRKHHPSLAFLCDFDPRHVSPDNLSLRFCHSAFPVLLSFSLRYENRHSVSECGYCMHALQAYLHAHFVLRTDLQPDDLQSLFEAVATKTIGKALKITGHA